MTTRAWKAWWFILPQILGYAVLSLLHRWNSLAALEHGRLFTDINFSGDANASLRTAQFLTLSYLFALYALTLHYWSRVDFTVRALAWSVAVLGLLAWIALPANSTDVFTYVAFGRIAAVHGANPYLHTYSEFADAFSPFAAGSAYSRMPMDPPRCHSS